MTDAFRDTFLDRWPAALRRLSFATTFVPLSEAERAAVLASCAAWNGDDITPDEATLRQLAARLDAAVAEFPDGAFVRLCSRSPKDSWDAATTGFRYRSGADVLAAFRDSERIWEDLERDRSRDWPSTIAVREWRPIEPGHEWRVFVRDRRIAGVSQYDYLTAGIDVGAMVGAVRWAIDTYFAGDLAGALHVDPVIADLWVRPRVRADVTTWDVRLIEINPWGAWTDPCLFDWKDAETWATREPYEVRTRVKGADR